MKPSLIAAVLVLALSAPSRAGGLVATETASFYNIASTSSLVAGATASLVGIGANWQFRVIGGSATFTISGSTGVPPGVVSFPSITVTDAEPVYGAFKFLLRNPTITLNVINPGARAMFWVDGGTGSALAQ